MYYFFFFFRYVAQNEVVERFIRFENVSVDRTAQALFNHIERILNEFELQTKLICQTYDGAAVMSGEHDQLQKLLQEKYPTAMFVHCYAHELNLVLQQSVNNITACKVFYSTCSGFAAFFSRAASRSVALTNYANKKFPTIGTRWVYNARLIKVLEEQHVELKALLEDMSNSTILDRETSATAKGFLNFISEQEFRFLLRIFAQIMPRAEILFETLQKTSKDVAFCSRQVDQFLNDVEKVREAVSSIWEEINDHPDDTGELTERGKRYRALGYQICDNISQRIRERFNSLPDFFDLLNVEKFKSHKKLFPHQSFYNLLKQYPMFKSIKSDLKLELECLYADPDCGKEKKVQDLYSYLKTSGLAQIWTEVSKLVELFLCIPATSVGVERSCSALKRIQTFQRNKQSQDRKSEIGLLTIEKKLLTQIQKKASFHDSVIDIFKNQKERRFHLDFK
ncbi:zinc finger MYM-type protein 1-like [Diaphorina citri]|uniref:Zinc finger MYM-type protein 1-like n=1 Tax=Diaphorina citri TaxID=121845 RepID=A0A3Q0ILJ7_DIACI|nr:zinc finger MYM-type protein 1-like [Diaphorina citri]